MKIKDIKKIGVVGAGTMGHSVALSFSLWGYPTILNDVSDDILNNAMKRIRSDLGTFVEEEVITHQQADDTLGRITTTSDLTLLAREVDYVCENIIELIQEKKELFNKLDALCPPHTILASNTSSLVLSEFGSDVKRQDKIVITHYFNPPHIMPCVEVVKGHGTSDETFNMTYELLEKVKKMPVRVLKELPGHMVNRIQDAMYREIYYLWSKGVASIEDIDRAVKGSFGFRLATIGPLLNKDLSGIHKQVPRPAKALGFLFRELSDAKEIPEKLNKYLESRRSFYKYSNEKWEQIIKQRDKEFLHRLKQLY
ncbi:3-hydroxyacyl-CoA dehydrogenase family protein [Chloroflexota bacterium]